MTAVSIFQNLPGCVIDSIEQRNEKLVVMGHSSSIKASCPTCGNESTSIHSYYTRRAEDLPVSEQAVELVLRVRRYRCRNRTCGQGTFAERLPGLLAVHAQRTIRLTTTLHHIGQALGGQAGARLFGPLHMSASPD